MTHCSNKSADNQIDLLLAGAEFSSYFSDMESCYVIRVSCACCGTSFEEELAVAKDKISDRQYFVCIRCDPEAEVASCLNMLAVLGGLD